ncbi:uncharacterized protein LOC101848981 [Aplysia californica]|uniref:Uncharacterized protein LOC101848981 n=1 Tax=Aplysia californica TaxID=6500 RepID=A0ABM0JUC1_APLCA|nr:uncharacterized protein LOC101848981 [Aplysia californica]
MECLKRFFCCNCNCRRRTVVSKLVPALMQLLVVLFVWFIFRTSTLDQREHFELLRSSRDNGRSWDEGLPPCSPGDYIRGKSLRLNTLMSGTHVLAAIRDDQPQFLNVEVIVRDLEQGTLVLYPIGTPVTFGGSSALDDARSDNDYYEYDDGDNLKRADSMVEVDIQAAKAAIKGGREQESYGQQVNYENFVNANDNFKSDLNGRQDENVGQSSQKFPSATGSQNAFNNMNTAAGIPGQSMASMTDKMNIPQNTQGVAAGTHISNLQKQSLSNLGQGNFVQSGLPFQQQVETGIGNQNGQQQQQQQQQQQLQQQQNQQNFPKKGNSQDSSYSSSVADRTGFAKGSSVAQNSISSNKVDAVFDENGPLYTDGFHERVASFRTEYYGKPVETPVLDASSNLLLNNPNACQGERDVDILYLVHAQPQSDEQRQGIRSTFVQSDVFKPFHIAYVFLVGRTTSPNFQNKLNREHEQYGDIVQGDFMDKPENATRKGIMGMEWAIQYCKSAKFIMKIDEDVFVDSDKLLRGLIPAAAKVIGPRAMLCFFNLDAPIPRSGTRAFSLDLFPHSSTLRPHCRGFAVLMTRGVLSSLLAASRQTPFVHLEDVYLYGILPFLAGHIEVYDVGNKRAFHDFGMEVVNCYRDYRVKCPFVASKAFSARFTNLWDFVKERMTVPHTGWEDERSLWDVRSFRTKF